MICLRITTSKLRTDLTVLTASLRPAIDLLRCVNSSIHRSIYFKAFLDHSGGVRYHSLKARHYIYATQYITQVECRSTGMKSRKSVVFDLHFIFKTTNQACKHSRLMDSVWLLITHYYKITKSNVVFHQFHSVLLILKILQKQRLIL